MKIWWFSKAGKVILKVILGIIVWIFFIIGVFSTWLTYQQLNDNVQLADFNTMVENLAFNRWYTIDGWNAANYKAQIFWHQIYSLDEKDKWKSRLEYEIPEVADAIYVNNEFKWYESNEATDKTLIFEGWSKFVRDNLWDPIYSGTYTEQVNDNWAIRRPWDPISIWNKYYAIRIDVSNIKYYRWLSSLAYNSEYKHFWENSVTWLTAGVLKRFIDKNTQMLTEWENACIILTSMNPIKKELKDQNPDCEYWNIPYSPEWYNRQIILFWIKQLDDTNIKPTIKVSPIELDILYN